MRQQKQKNKNKKKNKKPMIGIKEGNCYLCQPAVSRRSFIPAQTRATSRDICEYEAAMKRRSFRVP